MRDDSGVDQISARELPLYKVFCSDFDFRIPNYQRPYAWKVEQASQLLADLTDALNRGSDEPYFLGSVVLVQVAGSATADVIDGQQRLTTLTILLAILRDLTQSAELASELEQMIREPARSSLIFRPGLGSRCGTGTHLSLRHGSSPPSLSRASLRHSRMRWRRMRSGRCRTTRGLLTQCCRPGQKSAGSR